MDAPPAVRECQRQQMGSLFLPSTDPVGMRAHLVAQPHLLKCDRAVLIKHASTHISVRNLVLC